MARVNGLYGHIQRNNRKAAILICAFLALFLVTQFAVRLSIFWPMAVAEANGEVIPPVKPTDPLSWRLLGFAFGDGEAAFRKIGDPPAPEHEASREPETVRPPVTAEPRGPHRSANLIDAFRLMFTRSYYMLAQCLALLAFALYYVFTSARQTGLLIRFATRAQPLARKDYPALYNLVENLAITAGLPCPAIELIDSPKLNAYATGLTAASARIGLTKGLITTLDKTELETVIAHEITHIRNADTRLMAITKGCADLVIEQPRRMWLSIRDSWLHKLPLPLRIVLLVVFVLPPLLTAFTASPVVFMIVFGVPAVAAGFALLCKSMMHQSREFIADAGAVELTKNPAALISALRKMARQDAIMTDNFVMQAMMFSGPEGGWLSTHPAFDERIAAIAVHAGVQPHELRAVPPRRTPEVPSARLAAATAPSGRRAARTLAAPMNEATAARSFGLRSTPISVLNDKLPLPPSNLNLTATAEKPTVWQQIEMEGGLDAYIRKRPLLCIPTVAALVVMFQQGPKLLAWLGLQ